MGWYSSSEWLETFGGPPEPGEAYPDDPDALRDRIEEDEMGNVERDDALADAVKWRTELGRMTADRNRLQLALRKAAGALDFAATRIVNAEDNRHVRAMAVQARDAVGWP
jgi:hypothetical protein